MNSKVKWMLIFVSVFLAGGFSYVSIIHDQKTISGFINGGSIVVELFTTYVILTTISLFVFTSLVFLNDGKSLKIRLFLILHSVILSYTPLILVLLGVTMVEFIHPNTISLVSFLSIIGICQKSLAPIVLFYTYFKVYAKDFYRSCFVISAYILLIFFLTKLPVII